MIRSLALLCLVIILVSVSLVGCVSQPIPDAGSAAAEPVFLPKLVAAAVAHDFAPDIAAAEIRVEHRIAALEDRLLVAEKAACSANVKLENLKAAAKSGSGDSVAPLPASAAAAHNDEWKSLKDIADQRLVVTMETTLTDQWICPGCEAAKRAFATPEAKRDFKLVLKEFERLPNRGIPRFHWGYGNREWTATGPPGRDRDGWYGMDWFRTQVKLSKEQTR